jgi:phage baseplate assembly protein W
MSVRDIDLDPDKVFGIGFPLNYDSEASGFFTQNSTYFRQLQDNIKNLLSTTKGERPGNPGLGCDLRKVCFEQNEPAILQSSVEEKIIEALNEFLPFVTLKETKLYADGNTLNIVARFDSEFTDEVIETIIGINSAGGSFNEESSAGAV